MYLFQAFYLVKIRAPDVCERVIPVTRTIVPHVYACTDNSRMTLAALTRNRAHMEHITYIRHLRTTAEALCASLAWCPPPRPLFDFLSSCLLYCPLFFPYSFCRCLLLFFFFRFFFHEVQYKIGVYLYHTRSQGTRDGCKANY